MINVGMFNLSSASFSNHWEQILQKKILIQSQKLTRNQEKPRAFPFFPKRRRWMRKNLIKWWKNATRMVLISSDMPRMILRTKDQLIEIILYLQLEIQPSGKLNAWYSTRSIVLIIHNAYFKTSLSLMFSFPLCCV